MAQDLDGHMLRNTRFTVDFESRRRERPRQVGIDEPWRPLGGAKPPAGCEAGDRAIPWNRARRARRAGVALTLATTLLVAVLWFV